MSLYQSILILAMPIIMGMVLCFTRKTPNTRSFTDKDTKEYIKRTEKLMYDQRQKPLEKMKKQTKETLKNITPSQEKCMNAGTIQEFRECMAKTNDVCYNKYKQGELKTYKDILNCINAHN